MRSLGCVALSFLATAAAAAPICPDGRGVYVQPGGGPNELSLSGDAGTLTLGSGRAKLTYPFTVTSSNGFSRTYFTVSGKDAPNSVAMGLNPDFTAYRGQASAPYLVTPDLPVGFYYWTPFRSRPNALDILPGDTWQLVRCNTGPTR